MTVFEATLQYQPAVRQSRFFSDGHYMRAQNMVWTPMAPKKPTRQRQAVRMVHFWASAPVSCHQVKSHREHHHCSDPRRKTPNPHSLE
jgi:hypothetical protein